MKKDSHCKAMKKNYFLKYTFSFKTKWENLREISGDYSQVIFELLATTQKKLSLEFGKVHVFDFFTERHTII